MCSWPKSAPFRPTAARSVTQLPSAPVLRMRRVRPQLDLAESEPGEAGRSVLTSEGASLSVLTRREAPC